MLEFFEMKYGSEIYSLTELQGQPRSLFQSQRNIPMATREIKNVKIKALKQYIQCCLFYGNVPYFIELWMNPWLERLPMLYCVPATFRNRFAPRLFSLSLWLDLFSVHLKVNSSVMWIPTLRTLLLFHRRSSGWTSVAERFGLRRRSIGPPNLSRALDVASATAPPFSPCFDQLQWKSCFYFSILTHKLLFCVGYMIQTFLEIKIAFIRDNELKGRIMRTVA